MNTYKNDAKLFSEIVEIPEVLKQGYLPSLDGFRAIAIVLTIITHVFQTHYGPLGVGVFFVISGFLITTLLLKEKINKGDIALKKFYIRRFFRIIPVSWLYILVIVGISLINHSKIGTFSILSATFFFANIINDTWYFAHYWSLSVEEQYYIFFPSLVKYLSIKKYVGFLLFFLVIIFILRFYEDRLLGLKATTSSKSILHYIHYTLFLTKFDGIIIGALFSIATYRGLFKIKVSTWGKYLIMIVLPVLIFLIYEYGNAVFAMTIISILVSIMISINLTPSNDFVFKFLNHPIIKHIGVLSYSLYIWQQLFAYDRPWKNAFPYSDTIWLNMIFLYIVAYLSYNYFEKPFLKLKARFT